MYADVLPQSQNGILLKIQVLLAAKPTQLLQKFCLHKTSTKTFLQAHCRHAELISISPAKTFYYIHQKTLKPKRKGRPKPP
jgi:hypothetical protein